MDGGAALVDKKAYSNKPEHLSDSLAVGHSDEVVLCGENHR